MKKPQEFLTVTNYVDVTPGGEPLEDFIATLQGCVPEGARNARVDMEHDWLYDGDFYHLRIEWEETVVNKKYAKEMEKYNKYLAKQKKK